jgi:hypothetical protein
MRLTNTVLIALQASMGLGLVVPKDNIKKEVAEHKHKTSDDAIPYKKNFQGYEKITKITAHRYYGPKDHKHHHEEKEHDDENDDDKEEHGHHSHEVKEKHDKDDHHHESKKHDDDDHDHKAKGKGHKDKEEDDEEDKKHDHDEDDDDEDEAKKHKLIYHTEEYKKAKKGTKEKVPVFKDVVLETPQRHKPKHEDEQKHDKEEKKDKPNSKDGKMYKYIHRNGMDHKRDVDINIHAPTYELHHDSDKKQGHGNAKFVKILRVSSQGSHETKYPKYQHDVEKKHRKPTKAYHPLHKSLHQHDKSKHNDEHDKEKQHYIDDETARKLIKLMGAGYLGEPHKVDKNHYSLPKPHREHIKSKHYDSHDRGNFGSEKKYPQSGPETTKPLLDIVDDFFNEDNGHRGSPEKQVYRYKSYPSHDHSDKDHTSHHDERKSHLNPSKDHQRQYEPKDGYKSKHVADEHLNEKDRTALLNAIRYVYDSSYNPNAPKYVERPHKTKPSRDDQDSHHESEKEHHSHDRPSYRYEEHAEYKHDDNKKHIKLSEGRSSHYEPGYKRKEPDSHHDEKESSHDHEHEDSEKDQYSHYKPISQYKKNFDYKHDDEKKHIKLSKDRVSQHRPTYHSKKLEPHHDDKEAEHHEAHNESKDHHSHDKPSYWYKEHSEHKHDDDSERGPFDQRVKLDRKPIDYYRKSEHHKAHEQDDTKSYRDHQSHREPHTKRSNKPNPNTPLPRLNATQICNLEYLQKYDRERIVHGLPLDEDGKSQFCDMEEISPELIVKLNAMYAKIVDDPKYAPFIKYLATDRGLEEDTENNRKRSAPEISPEALAKIEAMNPILRGVAADKLDFNPKLKKEFVNARKLYPGLIKKLNKEYARVIKNPKYKKIVEKLKSPEKRSSPPTISNETLKKIEAMDPILRRVMAEKLDLPSKLTDEFVDCGKLDHVMVQKLNWEYSRIYNNPKYKKILKEFNTNSKRSEGNDELKDWIKDELKDLDKVETTTDETTKDENKETPKKLTENQLRALGSVPPVYREIVAIALDFPKGLKKQVMKNAVYKGELLDTMNKEWDRVQTDPKYKNFVKKMERVDKKVQELRDKKKEESKDKNKIRERSVHQLTEKQLESLLQLNKYDRQALMRKLKLDQSLAHEFVNASKLTPHFIEKFNDAIAKIAGTPEHQELLKLVGQKPPKDEKEDQAEEEALKLESVKQEVRMEIAKDLELDKSTEKEFLEAEELAGSLLEKLKKGFAFKRLKNITKSKKDDTKHLELVEELIRVATLKQEEAEYKESQRKDSEKNKKLTKTDEKLKEKLKKTKDNGWCNEFVGELEGTWNTSEKKTESQSS